MDYVPYLLKPPGTGDFNLDGNVDLYDEVAQDAKPQSPLQSAETGLYFGVGKALNAGSF